LCRGVGRRHAGVAACRSVVLGGSNDRSAETA
jgi:hypothetical protein